MFKGNGMAPAGREYQRCCIVMWPWEHDELVSEQRRDIEYTDGDY